MNEDRLQPSSAGQRIVWLDVIRLIAMLMVIGVHCIDPFYISPAMRDNPEYTRWAAIYGSLFRPSVPLFTMMTGLLLLPIRQPIGTFYKKRIYRILFPMLIWSVLYNLFPWFTGVLGLPKEIIGDFFCYVQGSESQALKDSLKDVAMIPFQFSFKENHMWYMYLLLGLYLYMPFFSAWIEKSGDKEKKIYLSLWGISLFLPYLLAYVAPLFGIRFLLGEATWNAFGLFYYFAGFNGYLVLGHYLKNGLNWSPLKTNLVSIALLVIGYAVTYSGFAAAAANAASTEEDMELFFTFCSPNVAIMTFAVFLLLRQVRVRKAWLVRALENMTKCGFGIYIIHYFVVGPFFLLIGPSSLPIPLQVPVMAICIFATSWAITALIHKLLGRKAIYIVG